MNLISSFSKNNRSISCLINIYQTSDTLQLAFMRLFTEISIIIIRLLYLFQPNMWYTDLSRNKQQAILVCPNRVFLIFQNHILAHGNAIIMLRLSGYSPHYLSGFLNSCSDTILNSTFPWRTTNNDYDYRSIWNLNETLYKDIYMAATMSPKSAHFLISGTYCLWTFWKHQRRVLYIGHSETSETWTYRLINIQHIFLFNISISSSYLIVSDIKYSYKMRLILKL